LYFLVIFQTVIQTCFPLEIVFLITPIFQTVREEKPHTSAKLLVLTHGPQAEMWSLDLVVEEHGPGPLAPGDVEHGLLMGQHSPQPVGMARSSSSKYISMSRVILILSVPTSGVLMEVSLCPDSSSWMTTALTSLMFSTGSMLSLAAVSIQSSRFGLVRAGPACRLSPSRGWGRTWG
jgi:hypothetical protein